MTNEIKNNLIFNKVDKVKSKTLSVMSIKKINTIVSNLYHV